MPTYYAYGEHNPSALNDPNSVRWESTSDWPRTYKYIPSYDDYQGIHPPAPVYQAQQPQPQSMYYYAHNAGTAAPTPYYANGCYYAAPQAPAAPTGYYCYPFSNPTPSWQQASNYYCYPVASATTANQPTHFIGPTAAQCAAQNNMIAYNTGATAPTQLAPYKPAPGQQFWCKELDGSWTLRSYNDITTGVLNPGHWELAKSGYHYWVMHGPS